MKLQNYFWFMIIFSSSVTNAPDNKAEDDVEEGSSDEGEREPEVSELVPIIPLIDNIEDQESKTTELVKWLK